MLRIAVREMEPEALRDQADTQIIIANLHWRYSGVTATNRMVAPKLAALMPTRWFGPDLPDGVTRLRPSDLLGLWRRREPLVWHARRNNEMIAGVVLKALGWPLKLLFTSAAQRHHSWITRWLIRRMDAVIATSATAASYVKRPAIVITHGVDTERYAPLPDRKAAFANAGLPGRYAIGCFGRVRAQKGTDLFVEAMCTLLPRYPDFIAVIVGQITTDQSAFAGRLRATIAAAGLHDRIIITGELPIDDVLRWYKRLTIYAFTSRNEGFGLTLIEAMASGAALVATRAGAAEIVIDHGETGVLVPVDDAAALTAAIEPLMRDPTSADRMGAKGRAHVQAHFSIVAEADAIAGVYKKLLEHGTLRRD